MLTVLWGLASDEPLAAVYEALQDRGCDVLLLDQRRCLETQVEIEQERLAGHLRYGDREVALEAIGAWYVRPYDSRRVPAVERAGPSTAEWRHAVELEDRLLGWLEMTPARVISRPSVMLPNACKPSQLRAIGQAGFAIPETLVTTDPNAARAFWGRHGEVIYKSVSGVRSRVARLHADDLRRFDDIACCPTQFQAYVAGRDHRVHVVGHRVYACEIESDADDYRDAGSGSAPRITAVRLPRELEDRIVRMVACMQLEVAGVDLRRTDQGEWYCFEVNPSPGFTFYEQYTGQGLASAIATLLIAEEALRRPSTVIFEEREAP